MNENQDKQPIFNSFLESANMQLQEADKYISGIKEVLDRINRETIRPEPSSPTLKAMTPPTEGNNTVVYRMESFTNSFARTNLRLRETYDRLSELA